MTKVTPVWELFLGSKQNYSDSGLHDGLPPGGGAQVQE